jgi:hypothetical protein
MTKKKKRSFSETGPVMGNSILEKKQWIEGKAGVFLHQL